jgi:hypothetical protein
MGEVINDRSIERDYQVGNGEGSIMLSIVIGDGQIGGSKVFLDDTMIKKGVVQHFPIGTPADLKNRPLSIRTNVVDVNPQTNQTSVTYILTGGDDGAEFTLIFEAPHDKDVVPYIAIFNLV